MKNLFLCLMFFGCGLLSSIGNGYPLKGHESLSLLQREVSKPTIYCVTVGGRNYCCEAATYDEAKSCARKKALEDLTPAPEEPGNPT